MTDIQPEVEEALTSVEAAAQATLAEIQAQLQAEEELRQSTGNNLSDPRYPPPWNRAILEVAQVMEEQKLATVAQVRTKVSERVASKPPPVVDPPVVVPPAPSKPGAKPATPATPPASKPSKPSK